MTSRPGTCAGSTEEDTSIMGFVQGCIQVNVSGVDRAAHVYLIRTTFNVNLRLLQGPARSYI